MAVGTVAAVVEAAPALATNTLYTSNYGNGTISFANLDDSGSGQLDTTGATVDAPWGVTIDPATNTIYWADYHDDTISFASLDGGGGGQLDTTGATLDGPNGVTIDPATNRIYWANAGNDTISYANLDDTGGGGQLNTAGATLDDPVGLAIDPATNKIYTVDEGNETDTDTNAVSFANLDGSGGGQLNTTGATIEGPIGAAIDPAADRIYVVNYYSSTISYVNLDGSGGGQLDTSGATLSSPLDAVILDAPSGTGAPAVTGGTNVGSVLSCSQGSWAPDLLGSFLYQAPESYGYSWTLNGQPVAGADSSSITTSSIGQYACEVTASNHAGSTSQASSAFAVGVEPVASTGTATSVSDVSAVLNGTVNPEGLATDYYFEYGTSSSYGSRAPASNASTGSDTTDHTVSQSISGLSPDQTYHFRLVASNADGTTYGTDQTLTTPPSTLSRLSVAPRKISIVGRKVRGKCLNQTKKNSADKRCKRPLKITVSYMLNAATTVTFTLKLERVGRRVHGKCLKPDKKNEHDSKCMRPVSIHGKLVKTGNATVNRFIWNGKVGGRTLTPGSYQLTATPVGGASHTLTFTIVGSA